MKDQKAKYNHVLLIGISMPSDFIEFYYKTEVEVDEAMQKMKTADSKVEKNNLIEKEKQKTPYAMVSEPKDLMVRIKKG